MVRGVRRLFLATGAIAVVVSTVASTASPRALTTYTLAPASGSRVVGQSYTLTATWGNPPIAGEPVTFNVTSGPNAGMTFSTTTDTNGNAFWTYASTATGTDTITATFIRPKVTTNAVTVTWNAVPKTDPKVTVAAPPFVRVGNTATFTAVVTNGGPDAGTGVELRAPVPSGTTLASASSTVGTCSGTTPIICAIGTLANGASATVTIVLTTSTVGALTLNATVSGDYDTNTGNNSASATTAVIERNAVPPAPPPSTAPGTYNAVGTGTIAIDGVVQPGDQQFALEDGDVVDVANGIITFTDSNGISGSWAKSRFTTARRTDHVIAPELGISRADDNVSSKFVISHGASGETLTLVQGDFSVCTQPRSLAAKSQRPVQQLWGSAKGAFTTKGRFAAATVRGTFWFIQDRCDGTLTQVVEGVVSVFDSTLQKTVSVGAGQSYLALAPLRAPRGTPNQTPAQVKRRGLVWGRKLYKTRKTFETYLKSQGESWALFAKAYPKLAAALAKRR
jgi:uncharacterized repeat protein (TIGR01451 family)